MNTEAEQEAVAKVPVAVGAEDAYDDDDAAPMGDFLFGECEDYLVNYQENQNNTKINKG